MFELERSSKREFYARLHREGRNFMKEDSYDYFDSNNQDEEVPEKEPDITWNVNDETSSQAIDNSDDDKQDKTEANQQQEDSQSFEATEDSEEPKGFWKKVKNILKG